MGEEKQSRLAPRSPDREPTPPAAPVPATRPDAAVEARPAAASAAPHVTPVRTYALVFGALLVLTAITTWVGTLELGPLNNIAALTIAVTKGVLVVLFFMHARYGSRLTRIVLVSG